MKIFFVSLLSSCFASFSQGGQGVAPQNGIHQWTPIQFQMPFYSQEMRKVPKLNNHDQVLLRRKRQDNNEDVTTEESVKSFSTPNNIILFVPTEAADPIIAPQTAQTNPNSNLPTEATKSSDSPINTTVPEFEEMTTKIAEPIIIAVTTDRIENPVTSSSNNSTASYYGGGIGSSYFPSMEQAKETLGNMSNKAKEISSSVSDAIGQLVNSVTGVFNNAIKG